MFKVQVTIVGARLGEQTSFLKHNGAVQVYSTLQGAQRDAIKWRLWALQAANIQTAKYDVVQTEEEPNRILVRASEALGTEECMGTIRSDEDGYYMVHLDGDDHEWEGPVDYLGNPLCNAYWEE